MKYRRVLWLSFYLTILSCFGDASDSNSRQGVTNGFRDATGRFWRKLSDGLSKSGQISKLHADFSNNSALRETDLICIWKQRYPLATAPENNGIDGKVSQPIYSKVSQPNYSSGGKISVFAPSDLEVSALSQSVLANSISRMRSLSLPTDKTILYRIHARWSYVHREPKRSRRMCLYYPNSCAARQILLKGGDISLNPGPPLKKQQVGQTTRRKPAAPRCAQCEKPVATNHKRCICTVCLDLAHLKCTNTFNPKRFSSTAPVDWICHKCTITVLPFHKHAELSFTIDDLTAGDRENANDQTNTPTADPHIEALEARPKDLKFMHLNTQSMVSTFDELLVTIKEYHFDFICMSETWLKENPHLLAYVSIPGFVSVFRNRDQLRGGGVGIYINENIHFKRRLDLEQLVPNMEHIWLEIAGRNKHSKLLLGVTYRSDRIMTQDNWLDGFETLLSSITASWDGLLLLTGDTNFDLLKPNIPGTKQYIDILKTFNLEQVVTKPTRSTATSQTIVDHFITNEPRRVTYTDVLPCPLVSDHDAPYVCMNVRVTRFQPRHKFIRDERTFNETAFLEDFKRLPLSIIYGVDDPEEKLQLFNTMFTDCLERHAPLKRIKVTRPPAPWLKDDNIQDLQKERNILRHQAHKYKDNNSWCNFRETRNLLKSKIRKSKRAFMQKALSSRNPKEVWQTIHRVIKPNPKPLRHDPEEVNTYFIDTASRTVNATAKSITELHQLIDFMPECSTKQCSLRNVNHHEVLREIKSLRSDCSTGPDQIPVKYIKMVAEEIASPLTHIINSCINLEHFPKAWKKARVSPIPKVNDPVTNSDLRGISILSALSKVYEKLAMRQMVEHIEANHLLPYTMSGFRKGHSTTTALLGLRDEITKAMDRGEITLMVFADFSRAFDTVHHDVLLRKLHSLGFSPSFLRWLLSYLTQREQFVQIDDKKSDTQECKFGVPQGSILGPVLFNLYTADLNINLGTMCNCSQYADDTSMYVYSKPSQLQQCVNLMNNSLNNLASWSEESKLALNISKTKAMLLTTSQMAARHSLRKSETVQLVVDDKEIEVVDNYKLLGVHINHTLTWDKHVSETLSKGYGILAVLRKLKNMAPFHLRKQLAESLVLSKIDYCDIVYNPITQKQTKKLQKLQCATASFVTGNYAKEETIVKLGWLPVLERREFSHIKATFRALHSKHWPENLKLKQYTPMRNLRSSTNYQLEVPKHGTFAYNAAKTFNVLPSELRNQMNSIDFLNRAKCHFLDKAKMRVGL